MILTAIFFGAVGLFGLVFFIVIVTETIRDARARSAARAQATFAPSRVVLASDRAGRFAREPAGSRQQLAR